MIKRNTNPRLRSKTRIRKKITGTPEVPRLTIYRSLNQMYAQIIDDTNGNTLVAASSLSKEVLDEIKSAKGKISKSKLVGNLVAKKAKEKNISNVVFDRNGYRYHGRVQAIAEGAREGGLKF
ncbi:MAG TPA: 50S ribosomal protein L18 [Ignavibacteriaceae bacterium]|nr:50S ribosomal protein L18 [Ignavibacteriaceae bacterium]